MHDKAIEYFEDAIRETDEILAQQCSPCLRGELTEQKAHFEVALAAMRKMKFLEDKSRVTASEILLRESLNQLEIHCDTCGGRSRGNCSDQSEQCGTQKLKDRIEKYLEAKME